ncbi:NAD(P)H-binding protein [Streptococcus sp. H31]|uniref:NAD(P)H-binding protein n=1 Tax=Streptococcus huangxiaojuni TaxID=3237239 RepID=UPI0034A218B7
MKNILILGANGQIARIVAERLLAEQPETHLTLYLRNSSRVNDLAKNAERVDVVEGDIYDLETLTKATAGQDLVFISNVDHDPNNRITQNVIDAMKANGVNRVVASNVLGIYNEVPDEFGRWNRETIGQSGLSSALRSDKLLEESGLDYTTLRLPWLNDRNEIDYVITHKNEEYVGVSGSRKSMADVVVRIAENFDFLKNDSVGIANAATQGKTRPVY